MTGSSSTHQHLSRTQRGLTLIEVMVALLVLSIGLIGIAGLTLFGLQSVHSSYQTSIASVIASDVEEWLWEAFGDNRLTDCEDFDIVVDAASLHWFSGAEVAGAVPVTLPGGSVTSACEPPTTGPYGCRIRGRIDVVWAEERFGDDGESFSYWIQVPCSEL